MTCLRCRHKDGSGAKFGEECALGRPKRFAAREIHTPKHPQGSRWVKFVDKWLPGQGSSAVPSIKLPFLAGRGVSLSR